eukprot:Protomagalhaensia_sp_Gyna_25__204@NODE_1098_length_2192_cov_385_755690_g868_i0_p1_GENE_NODE_1098_length_2192_cov_385_755690_g868_i0NODE_1098_length_2192_cov_385_755690_g868_i0_p1_ORF_typecomplete_len395_score87_39S1P1_nuclease/PF02265_16/1_9e33_NODE_1098_length_2192_cov_385_755690_g868_i0461230
MRVPGLFVLAGVATAWWNEGHHLLCRVALDTLGERDRQDVVDLAETITTLFPEEFPSHQTFQSACTWLDDVGRTGNQNGYVPLFSSLHFVNLPAQSVERYQRQDGTEVPEGEEVPPDAVLIGHTLKTLTTAELDQYIANTTRVDIIWAMRRLNTALHPTGGIDASRIYMLEHALNLKAYSHLIGDIHMPLHSCGLWNDKEHCAGGNAFKVDFTNLQNVPENPPTNLHYLWDSMCFWAMGTDLSPESIEAKATELQQLYPYATLEQDHILDLNDDYSPVYKESYQTCTGFGLTNPQYFIYKDNGDLATSILNYARPTQTFDEGYISWCQETSQRAITAGGYRLANQLISWYDNMDAAVKEAIYAAAAAPQPEPEGVTATFTFLAASLLTIFYALF